MAKLIELDDEAVDYRDLVAALLPRGPLWSLDNPGVRGVASGLGVEGVRFHNRSVALMREAVPRSAVELLSEWEKVFGLPLPGFDPTDLSERQAALSARVAARGGQDPHYYRELVRRVLSDPDAAVDIIDWPYGKPFRVSVSAVGDPLNGEGATFYWRVVLPVGTNSAQVDTVEALLALYKPGHTIVEVVVDI